LKYIIGAYSTAPSLGSNNLEDEEKYYKLLLNSVPNIRGLEIPFWGDSIHKFGTDFLFQYINPEWENVITCIPGSVMSLPANPKFGLASNDESGRNLALALHKKSNEIIHQINSFTLKKSIIAVQIATAPSVPASGVSSSPEALRKSLKEMCSWDWMGARLNIEHCDEAINGNPFEKGFLSLKDEIDVIASLSSESNMGITLNWARSAIEGKDPKMVIDHINLTQEKQLLSGFIFSGTSPNDKAYGIWKDKHMPFTKSNGIEHYEDNSLLTEENISITLNSIDINALDYIGIKLLSMPIESSTLERRVGVNRDGIKILNKYLMSR
jgi:hypothetical protein